MPKYEEILLEIAKQQNGLHKMLEEQNHNTEEVLEKSQNLDRLITTFYYLLNEGK